MKRIRISQNRADITIAIRESLLAAGHKVSEIFRDTNDTPSANTDGLVFITDAPDLHVPNSFEKYVSISDPREGDIAPEISRPVEVEPEPAPITEGPVEDPEQD